MRVFYTSPWVPAEWVRAHGLEPRGVWHGEDFVLNPAPPAAGVCAFAQAVVELAERQPGSAVIFTTHCDQLRRSFDAVTANVPARRFLLNLPATWQTLAAERLFCTELDRLGRFLVTLGGQMPTVGQLAALVAQYRQARRQLLNSALDYSALDYAEAVARFHWDGSVCLPDRRVSATAGVPLALVGGPLPRAQWRLLELLESAGARVVVNAVEPGERSLWASDRSQEFGTRSKEQGNGLADRNAGAPGGGDASSTRLVLQDLAREYLAHCVDVYQRPNTRLYAWLRERLEPRGARGILLWAYVGCDLWRAEAQSLRETFGLPVLLVDAEEVAGGWPRVVSRLEAFLEALR